MLTSLDIYTVEMIYGSAHMCWNVSPSFVHTWDSFCVSWIPLWIPRRISFHCGYEEHAITSRNINKLSAIFNVQISKVNISMVCTIANASFEVVCNRWYLNCIMLNCKHYCYAKAIILLYDTNRMWPTWHSGLMYTKYSYSYHSMYIL